METKMLFRYTFENPTIFYKSIELVKDIIDILNFNFSTDGICFQAMDCAHVALVSGTFHKHFFSTLEFDKGFVRKGIHLKSLVLCLKCYQEGDKVSFLETDNEDYQIEIIKKDNEVYNFILPTIEMETEELQIPEDEKYECECHLKSSVFHEMIKNVSVFGETISISNKGKLLDIRGENSNGSLCISKVLEPECISSTQNISASFSTKYFQTFARGTQIADTVYLWVSEEKPICFTYVPNETCSLQFYLAPKIVD